MSGKPTEFPIVEDAGTLAQVIEHVGASGLLAVDTEFIRERTYFPELCVLQIATPGMLAAIDCLADIDLQPMFDALLADEKVWLLHSARQDLEVVFYRCGTLPHRLIDTQIAAGLVGLPMQVGLQGLLEEILEIRIQKEHTRANWNQRPLAAALRQYALDDVRYLLPAWDRLEDRLVSLGRFSWFEEDCARQLGLPIEPDEQTLFERTRGTGSLKARQRAAAYALIDWRERRARKLDKPRRWILADDQLVRIAADLPETMAELERVRDLPRRLIARSGPQILEAIANAKAVDDAPQPPAADKAAVQSLLSAVRARAEAMGLQSELLATRRDIGLAAAGTPPDVLRSGWRHTVLGDLIDQFTRDRAH